MRTALAVLAVAALLAGCSQAPDATPTPAAVALPSPTLAPPVLPTATDTLHLLAAPYLTPTPPTGTTDTAIAVPSVFQAATNVLQWTVTLPKAMSVLSGNATLWVDVEGTVLGDPFPTSNGCFWSAFLTADPAQAAPTSACVAEPLQVQDGVRAIQLAFPPAQVAFPAGTTLYLQLTSNSEQAPGSSVLVLTGSHAHDSQVTIHALELPWTPALLAPVA